MRRLPWWMEDQRPAQYREEEKFESQLRLEAEMRLQQYRCENLFYRLFGMGLSLEACVAIAEEAWEIKISAYTKWYAGGCKGSIPVKWY